MELSTMGLVLAPEDSIDLQVHTTYSDGIWTPEQLLDHLAGERFALAAITDHDSVDSIPAIQQLAINKKMPILLAVEMTAEWMGNMTDVLCFGFDPEKGALRTLARDVVRRQEENTRSVYENLIKQGYGFALTKYPFKDLDEFRQYEREARKKRKGLWGRQSVQ